MATIQAFALAVFLLGIRPQGSLTFEGDFAGRENTLITAADYVETVSMSHDAGALDAQQSESILATDAFDTVEPDHPALLSLSHGQLTYRDIHIGFSLIRSPPVG